jgi:nitrogenase molybdenum-iron protein alpha/beta subunit
MSNEQIMILTNAALVTILGFMIRMWIMDLKQSIRDINGPDGVISKINKRLDNVALEKVGVKTCDRLHDEIKSKLHQHGSLGAAGEVMP